MIQYGKSNIFKIKICLLYSIFWDGKKHVQIVFHEQNVACLSDLITMIKSKHFQKHNNWLKNYLVQQVLFEMNKKLSIFYVKT